MAELARDIITVQEGDNFGRAGRDKRAEKEGDSADVQKRNHSTKNSMAVLAGDSMTVETGDRPRSLGRRQYDIRDRRQTPQSWQETV